MISQYNNDLLDSLVDSAVQLSVDHVLDGGIPFAALIVDQKGTILGTGVNQVVDNLDPTAHAEVTAIRDACKHLTQTNLRGATLIASGEPCALCYMSALWSGIDQIIYAVDRDKAAAAGFDYRWTYYMFAKDTFDWPIDVQNHETAKSYLPFKIWNEKHR